MRSNKDCAVAATATPAEDRIITTVKVSHPKAEPPTVLRIRVWDSRKQALSRAKRKLLKCSRWVGNMHSELARAYGAKGVGSRRIQTRYDVLEYLAGQTRLIQDSLQEVRKLIDEADSPSGR